MNGISILGAFKHESKVHVQEKEDMPCHPWLEKTDSSKEGMDWHFTY